MASADEFRRYLMESGQQSYLDQIQSQPGGFEQAFAEYNAGGGSSADPVQSFIDAQMEVYDRTIGQALKRAEQFEKENPFAFDEEAARASSIERLDPYYQSELKDFITGVERGRSRSIQDEKRIQQELTASTESYVGTQKRELDEALDSSREGFAGTGLFFSGKRMRREGQIGIEAEQNISDYTRRVNLRGEEARLGKERTLEDLGLQESRERRLLGAERETGLLTDVEQQKQEQLRQREFERQQFIGYPLVTGGQGLNALLG